MVPTGDHECEWKEYALTLQKQLDDVGEKQRLQQEQLDALKQKIFGKSSEKMPPMEREVRRGEQPDPAKGLLKRRANAELRAAKIKTEVVDVSVPATERHCPKCDGSHFTKLGEGKPSQVTEYIQGYFSQAHLSARDARLPLRSARRYGARAGQGVRQDAVWARIPGPPGRQQVLRLAGTDHASLFLTNTMMTNTMTLQFTREYRAEILEEVPGDGQICYFPEAQCESPLLVRFTLPDGASWVGGFGGGSLAARACTGVFASPSPTQSCVVSRGRAYLVEVREPGETMVLLSELVTQVVADVPAGALLLADPWQLHAYGTAGLSWSSGRIATEGFQVLSADERIVVVRMEDPDGELEDRRIDVRTGQFV